MDQAQRKGNQIKVTPSNSRQKIENCSNYPDRTVHVQRKSFSLITYLFLLAERAVFKFSLKMISNGKLKQLTCRS